MRGLFEFQSSILRLHYSVTEAPGRRNINGTVSSWRVGYKDNLVTLAGLLPPFVIPIAMVIAYVVMGPRTECSIVSTSVNPMSSIWLIAANAIGGNSGQLQAQLDKGIDDPRDPRVLALGVKFHKDLGLVSYSSSRASIADHLDERQRLELAQGHARNKVGSGYTVVNSSDGADI